MAGMLFVIILLIVLFAGVGSIMLIGSRLREDQEPRLVGTADPASIKRLTDALDGLQGQVDVLSERLDFTERLLEAPKETDSDSA